MKSNWEHSHTGVFVKDFAKTLKYYKSLGLAPELPPRPRRPTWDKVITIEFDQVVQLSAPDPKEPFLELLYIGDLELEVLHAPAKRPKGEALAYAAGVNHVCFSVPDIDGETDLLVQKGFRVIQDAKLNGVTLEDYLDTREVGNMLLSLRPLQSEEMKARKAGYGIVSWNYLGVGAVVKDLKKTAAYYATMDLATFYPQKTFGADSVKDLKVYGKTPRGAVEAKIRRMAIGPVTYELIEPVKGNTIYSESLDRRGEGIINLAFAVGDLAAETSKLVKKGVPVIFSGKPEGGKPFAYFDTREDGGDVMIKLVQK